MKLQRVEELKDYHTLPPGHIEVLNIISPGNRRAQLPTGQMITCFSTKLTSYEPSNHHLWCLQQFPAFGQVLIDRETLQRYMANTCGSFIVFGNAERGVDRVHLAPGAVANVFNSTNSLVLVPKCAICGEAVRRDIPTRCSKCKSVYYCTQQHQYDHWPLHKTVCASLAKSPTAQLVAAPQNTYLSPDAATHLASMMAAADESVLNSQAMETIAQAEGDIIPMIDQNPADSHSAPLESEMMRFAPPGFVGRPRPVTSAAAAAAASPVIPTISATNMES